MEKTSITEMESAIHLDQLSVGYGKKVVVGEVSFQVKPGEIVTLVGPNGSGKSTILKTITRQLKGLKGVIFLNGKNQEEMSGTEIARHLSMVMTQRIAPELMSCRELVSTGRYPYTGHLGFLSEEDRKIIEESMALMEITDLADQSFLEISDGQRQRVMLARAICQNTQIMILDEPTSYLDIYYKLDLLGKIQKLVKERKLAVIMSLHELDLAVKISDRILCVSGERIVKAGTPKEVTDNGFLQELYGLKKEQFQPYFGSSFLPKVTGKPKVFVISGGGRGVATFFALQRRQIPFAVGILAENDSEYTMAQAMATEVVGVKAYHPIGAKEIERSKELILMCEQCICCLKEFGPLNEALKELQEYAVKNNRLVSDYEE